MQAKAADHWRIDLLGRVVARRGSRTISRFLTQKTGSLLAYLAIIPERATRATS